MAGAIAVGVQAAPHEQLDLFWRMYVNPKAPSLIVSYWHLAGVAALASAATGLPLSANAQYAQTNLVSNIPGLATLTEARLVNPWGLSRTRTSPFWTSNQGTNSTHPLAVDPAIGTVATVLGVNAKGSSAFRRLARGPQGPTGQVNNTNTATFQLTPGNPRPRLPGSSSPI